MSSVDDETRSEAIKNFCSITQADEELAQSLLEACDWNVELAINMHVDSYGIRPSQVGGTSAGPSGSNAAGSTRVITIPESLDSDDDVDILSGSPSVGEPNSRRRPASRRGRSGPRPAPASEDLYKASGADWNDTDNVRPPIAPIRQVLVDTIPDYSPDMPPAAHRYSSRSGPAPAYDAFRDFQAETRWQESARQEGESTTSDPRIQGSLVGLYRPPLELMYRGSLSSARELATTSNKWLLVNIQVTGEFSCHILNRDVWSHPTVKEILKEHFVFWQVYRDSFEGSKYVQFYNVTSFPHVSVIDPRTGELVKSWVPALKEKETDGHDHNIFCDLIIEFLTEHPSPDGSGECKAMKKMRVKEVEASQTLYDQSEEAQLEAAIKASLQEVENSNSSSTGNKVFIDEDSYTNDPNDSDSEQQQQSNRKKTTTTNATTATTTASASTAAAAASTRPVKKEEPEEDYKTYLGSDTDKFSDLVVRFPDGTRDKFKFPADSKMMALFLLLSSRGYSRNQYNYVTTFPRRLLHELPESDTLNEVGLVRETIFVERKISDDATE